MKAIYIHGFGSTAKTSSTMSVVREVMGKLGYAIEAIEWDTMDPEKSIYDIEQYIRDNGVDVVIGHSLGAFMTLCITEPVKKILINPCLHPGEDLKKITDLPKDVLHDYAYMERWIDDGSTPWVNLIEDKLALFGDDDELFDYYDEYSARLGQALRFPSKHRPTVESFDIVLNELQAYLLS